MAGIICFILKGPSQCRRTKNSKKKKKRKNVFLSFKADTLTHPVLTAGPFIIKDN